MAIDDVFASRPIATEHCYEVFDSAATHTADSVATLARRRRRASARAAYAPTTGIAASQANDFGT